MGAESSTMQNAASTCKGCKNLGNKQVDTVKVDMSKLPEASATGKENSNPGQMRESQAEKNYREEQQRLKQFEEEEARRRKEEEGREARRRAEEQRQLQLEMHKRQEQEQERQRLAEEEEARIAEQKRRQAEEEERLRRIQQEKEEEEVRLLKQKEEEVAARRREEEEKEEARRNENLRAFLGKAGFNAVSEKKVKKSMINSSFSYPLHAAVEQKDAEAVSLLLWAGADPELPNSKKLTPLKLALSKNKQGSHDKVIAALAA